MSLPTNDKTTVRNIVVPEEMKTKFMAPLFVFQPDGSVVTSEDYVKLNQEKKPAATTAPAATAPVTAPTASPTSPLPVQPKP